MAAYHISHPSTSTVYTSRSSDSTNASSSPASPTSHTARCPNIILDSTSTFYTTNIQSPSSFLAHLRDLPIPITALDLSPRTESNIGAHVHDVKLGTKVRILGASIGNGKGELKAWCLRESATRSLATTHASELDYLIAQRVDPGVSVGEVAGGFGGLVGEGVIEKWGVRQFPLRDLQNLVRTCQNRGFHTPTVYQAEYNLLSRPKDDLVEYLKKNGMVLHAFAPTANGFLRQVEPVDQIVRSSTTSQNPIGRTTSTLSQTSTVSSGNTAWRGIYDKPENREAVKKINEVAMKHDLTLHSASLRWLAYHSRLSSNDSIILSASSWRDLEDRLGQLAKGPLPDGLVAVIEEVGYLMHGKM